MPLVLALVQHAGRVSGGGSQHPRRRHDRQPKRPEDCQCAHHIYRPWGLNMLATS